MIKQYQLEFKLKEDFQQQKESLNLQMDEQCLYLCIGKIKVNNSRFLPRSSLLIEKLIEKAHCEILHGGVGLTMS